MLTAQQYMYAKTCMELGREHPVSESDYSKRHIDFLRSALIALQRTLDTSNSIAICDVRLSDVHGKTAARPNIMTLSRQEGISVVEAQEIGSGRSPDLNTARDLRRRLRASYEYISSNLGVEPRLFACMVFDDLTRSVCSEYKPPR